MCFNKEASISTFIASSVLSFLLFTEGDKYDKMIAIFCFVFGNMQLAEFFMWLDQDCGDINHYGSIYGEMVLAFQPLSILLAGFYYKTFILPDFILICLIVLSLVPIVFKIFKYMNSDRKLCSLETESGQLEWDFTYPIVNKYNLYFSVFYFFMIIGSWGLLKHKIKGPAFLLFSLSSIGLAQFSFKEWESTWCFFSNLAPLVFLILSKILN